MTDDPGTITNQLAVALAAALPSAEKWNVVRVGREPDQLTRPTAVVYRTQIAKAPQAPTALRNPTFDVWVITAADGSDDQLDTWVDTLIDAVESIPWADWTGVTREVYRTAFPGYRVEVTATTRKETTP